MSKFAFLEEEYVYKHVRLRRIVALQPIAARVPVVPGQKGGFLENESNLDQAGDCWVGPFAMVMGAARVSGNAYIGGNAKVLDSARVSGDAAVVEAAVVKDSAEVGGSSYVGGCSVIIESAKISSNAVIGGESWVSGKCDSEAISISGFPVPVTICGDYVNIGCDLYAIASLGADFVPSFEQKGGTKALAKEIIDQIDQLRDLQIKLGTNKLAI